MAFRGSAAGAPSLALRAAGRVGVRRGARALGRSPRCAWAVHVVPLWCGGLVAGGRRLSLLRCTNAHCAFAVMCMAPRNQRSQAPPRWSVDFQKSVWEHASLAGDAHFKCCNRPVVKAHECAQLPSVRARVLSRASRDAWDSEGVRTLAQQLGEDGFDQPAGITKQQLTRSMSCIWSFSTALGAACSGPNGPSLSPSSGGALAPRCATMLWSGCISRMAPVPTNHTNARAEETVYTNKGTNVHVSRPLPSNLRKEPATGAAPLLLYSI